MDASHTGAAVTVRPLADDDFDAWLPLWRGYTAFYRSEQTEEASRSTFRRLREHDDLVGLVAVAEDGDLVGLAHLVIHENTWAEASSCYLNDLYVDPASRGSGAAHVLFEAIYASARERGCDRVYWHTQQFNGAARSLYDTVGSLTSFIVYERELG
jgi:GNAT superfamily N-acetyltransferase